MFIGCQYQKLDGLRDESNYSVNYDFRNPEEQFWASNRFQNGIQSADDLKLVEQDGYLNFIQKKKVGFTYQVNQLDDQAMENLIQMTTEMIEREEPRYVNGNLNGFLRYFARREKCPLSELNNLHLKMIKFLPMDDQEESDNSVRRVMIFFIHINNVQHLSTRQKVYHQYEIQIQYVTLTYHWLGDTNNIV